jgi:hypothetical protein
MSISELLSELNETFIRSNIDIVKETLIAREEMLKAEIEEKNIESELIKGIIEF